MTTNLTRFCLVLPSPFLFFAALECSSSSYFFAGNVAQNSDLDLRAGFHGLGFYVGNQRGTPVATPILISSPHGTPTGVSSPPLQQRSLLTSPVPSPPPPPAPSVRRRLHLHRPTASAAATFTGPPLPPPPPPPPLPPPLRGTIGGCCSFCFRRTSLQRSCGPTSTALSISLIKEIVRSRLGPSAHAPFSDGVGTSPLSPSLPLVRFNSKSSQIRHIPSPDLSRLLSDPFNDRQHCLPFAAPDRVATTRSPPALALDGPPSEGNSGHAEASKIQDDLIARFAALKGSSSSYFFAGNVAQNPGEPPPPSGLARLEDAISLLVFSAKAAGCDGECIGYPWMDSDSEEEELSRKKRAACVAVMAACMAIIPILHKERDREKDHERDDVIPDSIPPDIARDSKRERYIRKIIKSTDKTCIDMTRMSRAAFHHLCGILRRRGLLRNTLYVSVEEQLVMFLNTVGHGVSNRVISRNFTRSGETVSRYFNIVLKAVASLKDEYIKGPASSVPPEISSDNRYWPWFKDCIGAIDGTHFPATVPTEIRSRFRGQEEHPTQNVLAAVNFDLTFSYILAGWEGSADDSRILNDALGRENGLKVPEGKYYLVDAGHGISPGFMAPYPGARHQLVDFTDDHPPQDARDLFNLHHSFLRARMEHALGVLKTRFRFLTTFPQFPFHTQVDIVLVCCILHNMIIEFDPADEMLTECLSQGSPQGPAAPGQCVSSANGGKAEAEGNTEWCSFRDMIADEMWTACMTQPL
ncbi:hypothetical protein Taro_006969 [Colocasia esculenta]|uniref:DDE Tnp4 domain-containing protein n=1 Tax=Colocasia esculenta TaxID=4460 RepID=A0A843TTW2_COLES|nr:hypothetical protein [Colocasia esculenta]